MIEYVPTDCFITRFRTAVSVLVRPCCPALLNCIDVNVHTVVLLGNKMSLPVIAEIETLKNGIQTIVTTKLFHPTTASTHYTQLTGYRSQQRHTMPIMLYVLWQI